MRGGYGRPATHIHGYSLSYPSGWTARLWPDTLSGYGQLDLYSPAGTSIEVLLTPLRLQGPTVATLLAHDASSLTSAAQGRVALPLGTALRLSGLPAPVTSGRASQVLYLVRGGLVYRLSSTYAARSPERAALLQVAATMRVLTSAGGPSRVPPSPTPSGETCCHCPAWGSDWGTVLTRLDGVPVYWNAGDVDNGCVGTYGIPYQCVELVQRYFSVRWGYPPIWRGVAGAADMRWDHPAGVVFIPNGGAPGPREGDALLFYGGGVGHVALVQSVNRQIGTITVVEENWSPTGEAILSLYSDNTVGIRNSAYGSYTIAGWLHSLRNVG